MSLIIPKEWRYGSPAGLDRPVVNAFDTLVQDIAGQDDSWSIFELFKRKFSPGCGTSSSESWAISDLDSAITSAAKNGPKFIAAFWAGCEEIKQHYPHIALPDAGILNQLFASHDVPYEIRPPHLVARDLKSAVVVTTPEKTIDERANDLIRHSLDQAERFLLEQRPRPAVQEILWLLETVSTAFQGLESGTGTVEGKYFNEIIRDLRRHNSGTALREILGWIGKLHGFLSSPSGGGVRHGTQLAADTTPSLAEAQLYCNLTRSYINYLLKELTNVRASSNVDKMP